MTPTPTYDAAMVDAALEEYRAEITRIDDVYEAVKAGLSRRSESIGLYRQEMRGWAMRALEHSIADARLQPEPSTAEQ
jgi:hypothetical protein